MSFLESIGLTGSTQLPPKSEEVPEREYKGGLVYIYCDPADRELARHLAKECGVSMKVLLHRLLFAAEIAIPNKTKVTVLNGAAFWEMFDVMKGDDTNDKS
jgi:hypothetical protein